MSLMLPFPKISMPFCITHQDPIFLIGSCFTGHLAKKLLQQKFKVMENPSGNLFDPISIWETLLSYTGKESVHEIFYYDELWHSWKHNTEISDLSKSALTERIKTIHSQSHTFLQHTRFLFITLGSAFSYFLNDTNIHVANCHKYPIQHFTKKLIKSDEIINNFLHLAKHIRTFNPDIKIIFTISPVRHIRDTLIQNNRSKAQLIEAVHSLINEKPDLFFYFPAYEIMIDVLRDYRFYDIDGVHPNFLGTELIFEHFIQTFMASDTRKIIAEIQPLLQAMQHKPRHPDTRKHKQFLSKNYNTALQLSKQYPFLNLNQEILYFSTLSD